MRMMSLAEPDVKCYALLMHMTMTALDPPGATDRRWRCTDCGLTGTFDDVRSKPCPAANVGTITPAQQLEAWAKGENLCPNTMGECCPDFSCCRPAIGWPLEKRAKFVAADQGTREKMMMGAVRALVAPGVEVHVTRGEPTDHE